MIIKIKETNKAIIKLEIGREMSKSRYEIAQEGYGIKA